MREIKIAIFCFTFLMPTFAQNHFHRKKNVLHCHFLRAITFESIFFQCSFIEACFFFYGIGYSFSTHNLLFNFNYIYLGGGGGKPFCICLPSFYGIHRAVYL